MFIRPNAVMSTEVDKRVSLFKIYIDLRISDYPLLREGNLDGDLANFRSQLANFTRDITAAANKMLSDFVPKKAGEEELLKSKLMAVIGNSRERFARQQ